MQWDELSKRLKPKTKKQITDNFKISLPPQPTYLPR
jgi:hypothetical protein